jgi:hypothetical protein
LLRIACDHAVLSIEAGSMSLQRWLEGTRLFLGFLLAPVIVTISLSACVDLVFAYLGANPDGPAEVMLGIFLLTVGLGMPYFAALCVGLPYVIALLNREQLNFRTVMIPTLVISVVYPLVVYFSLCNMHPSHLFAEAVAAPQVLDVILAGLCFYFIGVWKAGWKAQGSPS